MTIEPWDPHFEAILRTYLPELPPADPLPENVRLANLGLDSLRTLGLILDIQEQYQVTFTDDELNPDTFATSASLWGALAKLTAEPR
ncbi:phosphopantetheine-binding protein [Actinophytocola glycyrrhizae]|uniref:Phosphopantetheine-binding protein n=1 Tax=Actinophytocola glycyrrhizae TaxID=2044873 RepID=A0ABV9SEF5_9PSEU